MADVQLSFTLNANNAIVSPEMMRQALQGMWDLNLEPNEARTGDHRIDFFDRNEVLVGSIVNLADRADTTWPPEGVKR